MSASCIATCTSRSSRGTSSATSLRPRRPCSTMPAARRCRRAKVAAACGKLILAEPAPGVRGRLIARFAPNTKIRVRSLDDVRKMQEQSIDLVVMNSVAQYMTPDELDAALLNFRRILKPVRQAGARRYPPARMSACSGTSRRCSLRPASRLPERCADRADQHRAVGLPSAAHAHRAAALQRGRDHRQARRPPASRSSALTAISATIAGA